MKPLYVLVEKILADGEPLPTEWATHGTTGYEFIGDVASLLVSPDNEEPLTAAYISFTNKSTPFEDAVREATGDHRPQPLRQPRPAIAIPQRVNTGPDLTHGHCADGEILRGLRHADVPAVPEGPVSWGLCEALLEESRKLRFTDRPQMLRVANVARLAADRLDVSVYGADQRTDMQARTWAELANAYRALANDGVLSLGFDSAAHFTPEYRKSQAPKAGKSAKASVVTKGEISRYSGLARV